MSTCAYLKLNDTKKKTEIKLKGTLYIMSKNFYIKNIYIKSINIGHVFIDR